MSDLLEFIGVCKDCGIEFYQGQEEQFGILPSGEMVCQSCIYIHKYPIYHDYGSN